MQEPLAQLTDLPHGTAGKKSLKILSAQGLTLRCSVSAELDRN